MWVDYTALQLKADQHLENVALAGEFHNLLDLDRMNSPTDRERWLMTPQTVNAYYHPSLNEIVFPAAILQPPFFNIQVASSCPPS
jgi:putative endopeptidase